VWRSGTFLLYSCKAAFRIQEMSPRLSDVECSVVLQSVFAISNTLAYLLFFWECATPPHVQVRHTTWQFYQAFPALVLQVKNAGVRRPGYEATMNVLRMAKCSPVCRFVNQKKSTINDSPPMENGWQRINSQLALGPPAVWLPTSEQEVCRHLGTLLFQVSVD